MQYPYDSLTKEPLLDHPLAIWLAQKSDKSGVLTGFKIVEFSN